MAGAARPALGLAARAFARDAFADRVVVITGGGTGIGRALAHAFARCGAKLVLASRKRENLERVAGELADEHGAESLVVTMNVREPDDARRMIDEALVRFARIDVLVNNAGANFLCPAQGITPNGWRTIVDVVLNGTFYCSQAAARPMLERRSGRIISLAATNGLNGSPLIAPSGAAKAGVINLTRSLAAEYGPFGVTVNAIAPGAVATEGATERLFKVPGALERIAREVPLGRVATAEDCVGAVLFLASDAAAFVNGATLVVDGGELCRKVPSLL